MSGKKMAVVPTTIDSPSLLKIRTLPRPLWLCKRQELCISNPSITRDYALYRCVKTSVRKTVVKRVISTKLKLGRRTGSLSFRVTLPKLRVNTRLIVHVK